jgi:NADH:ubiquinone oxidoreductase subunit 4 (subunit M)
MLATVLGMYCLFKIKAIDNEIGLHQFHGYVYERPAIALLFLVACFAMIGLPFTPTFIGIDILFSHIHKREWVLIAFTALSFIFVELSVVRIYARIFLGIHKKSSHAAAYRSS